MVEKSGKLYEYGCVMIYFKIPNWESIVSKIETKDLYDPHSGRHGLETQPHITVLYGLHSEVNEQQIEEALSGISDKDIDIEIDGINFFENKDFDVVKMNIKSDVLHEMNRRLSGLPHTTDYPEYKPHMTVAYVLPGLGKKYLEPTYHYKFNDHSKVVYSKTDGTKSDIKLLS